MFADYDDYTTQPILKKEEDSCSCKCGAWTTYGENISDFQHSDWCPRKIRYNSIHPFIPDTK